MILTVLRIIITLVLTGLLTACSGGGSPATVTGGADESRSTVLASFYPLAFAARQIAGDTADVGNLTPAGVEPHDLELAPRDIAEIREADLLLYVGGGFQPAVDDAARHVRGDAFDVLETPGLKLREAEGGTDDEHGDGDEAGKESHDDTGAAVDPHVWLDPLAYRQVALQIGERLGRQREAAAFAARLEQLHGEFQSGLAECERRGVVTSHDAFSYLTRRYDLEQVPISGVSPEAEPRPAELEHVVEAVRDSGARVIYFETLASPRLAETVARETGARTAVLNPLEGLTPQQQEQGDDYFSVMRGNLRALREGLGCR